MKKKVETKKLKKAFTALTKNEASIIKGGNGNLFERNPKIRDIDNKKTNPEDVLGGGKHAAD